MSVGNVTGQRADHKTIGLNYHTKTPFKMFLFYFKDEKITKKDRKTMKSKEKYLQCCHINHHARPRAPGQASGEAAGVDAAHARHVLGS